MPLRTRRYKTVFVDNIPENIKPGYLYISLEFCIAMHLCACGCGHRVVTPLGKEGWKVSCVKNKVTLCPSIGNFDYPCMSHYFIIRNKVVWCKNGNCKKKPWPLKFFSKHF